MRKYKPYNLESCITSRKYSSSYFDTFDRQFFQLIFASHFSVYCYRIEISLLFSLINMEFLIRFQYVNFNLCNQKLIEFRFQERASVIFLCIFKRIYHLSHFLFHSFTLFFYMESQSEKCCAKTKSSV